MTNQINFNNMEEAVGEINHMKQQLRGFDRAKRLIADGKIDNVYLTDSNPFGQSSAMVDSKPILDAVEREIENLSTKIEKSIKRLEMDPAGYLDELKKGSIAQEEPAHTIHDELPQKLSLPFIAGILTGVTATTLMTGYLILSLLFAIPTSVFLYLSAKHIKFVL